MPSAAQIPRHDGERGAFPPLAPPAIAGRSSGRWTTRSAWCECRQQRWRMRVHDGNASQRTCLWHGRELRQKSGASPARSLFSAQGAGESEERLRWPRKPCGRAVCARARGGPRSCRGPMPCTTARSQRDRRFRRKMRCNPSCVSHHRCAHESQGRSVPRVSCSANYSTSE